MNTISNILVNKDLKMSAGKAMAQVAHAVLKSSRASDLELYNRAFTNTVIFLEASESQIDNLWMYLQDRGIHSDQVIDEGVNEILTMSTTVLAVEPLSIEDREKRDIFRGFKLYKHGRFQR